MDIEKVFVKSNNMATITCPDCNLIKNIQAGKYRHMNKPLKVRCRCNNIYAVSLDFRQHFRKSVALTGTYRLKPPANGEGMMQVRNISRSGIGFSVGGIHSLQPGQKARIEFTLNNVKQTKLDKKVSIVSVKENFVGCVYLNDQPFEKDLGFYLRS